MGTKQYDSATDLITFSRASGGTALRKVSYGNELVTNGTFNTDASSWTLGNSPTVSVVSGAVRVAYNATANGYIQQEVLSLVVGRVYTVTVDLVGTTGTARVDLDHNGVDGVGNVILNATSATSGSYIFTAAATSATVQLYNLNSTGYSDYDNVSIKEVTFDQADGTLELFNHPDDIPRIEYDAAGAVKGLLIEEARTNLITYSSDLDNAAWSRHGGVALDAATNQFGLNMTTLTDANAAGFGHINNPFTLAPSTVYTMSGYVTRNPSATSLASIRVQQNDNILSTQFSGISINPTDGTFGSPWTSGLISRNVVPYGPDLYFWYVTFTTSASITTPYYQVFPAHYDLSGGDGAAAVGSNSFGGLQIEEGGFPSSYIPTTGAAATRAADVALIPTSAFGFNSEAMTVVVDCSMSFDGTNYPRVWEIGSSINNHDRINVYIKADGGNYGVGLQTANVSQGSFTLSTGNSVPTAQVKIAYALREDDIAAVQDGGVVQTNGSGTLKGGNPRTLLALGGSTAYAADYMNGHIKSIQYYPRRLTNAQLQELTT